MIWLGVPSGVGLWIFYDPDADGPDPAEWNHVSSHEVFYAGDKRPFSFSLAYEGSAAALECCASICLKPMPACYQVQPG